ARAAVDDPQDLEREDPRLAPGGDDPQRGGSRADRRRLTCGSAAVCIGARARNVRGWPDTDAVRLLFVSERVHGISVGGLTQMRFGCCLYRSACPERPWVA